MHKLIDTMKSKLTATTTTTTPLHNNYSTVATKTIQISNSIRSNASDNMKQKMKNDLTII